MYDPAAGKGNLAKFLPRFKWVLHDMYPVEGVTKEDPLNYLLADFDEYSCLITNPPFSSL